MFYQQLSDILTTSPGNLTYHLVTAFSVAWALQVSIARWHTHRSPRAKRLVVGISLLFAVRLLLFFFSAFLNQGQEAVSLLPPADRAVTIFSLLIIAWLWCFPDKNRPADMLLILLAILDVLFLFVSIIAWSGHHPDLTFNASLLSPSWEGIAVLINAAGIIILLLRRPRNWGIGAVILGVNFCGHMLALLAPILDANYSVSVRLAQLITFPLLYTLTQDNQSFETHLPYLGEQTNTATSSGINRDYVDQLNALMNAPQDQLFPSLGKTLCQLVTAEYCIFLSPPNYEGLISTQGIYDREQRQFLPAQAFNTKQIPLLANALQRGRTFILPAENNSQDVASLKQILHIEQNQHVLAASTSGDVQQLPIGVLLLREEPKWSDEDEEYVPKLVQFLYKLTQHSQQPVEARSIAASGSLSPSIEEEEAAVSELALDQEQDFPVDEISLDMGEYQIEDLKKAIINLKKNNDQRRELEKELRASIKVTRKEAQEKDQALTQMQHTLEDVKTQAEENAQTILKLQQSERDLRSALDTALQQNETSQAAIKRLTEETAIIPVLTQRESELQAILTKVQAQNQELVSALQSAEKEAQKLPALIQQEKKLRTTLTQAEVRYKERIQEIGQLQQTIQTIQSNLSENQKERSKQAQEIERLTEELSKALASIDTLKTHVSQTEQKALEVRDQIAQLSSQQMAEIASSVQELRYPLSTIVDYSDLMLDESVGALGALQRKFLERLKEAVRQLEIQINQVVQIIVLDSTKISISSHKFDLNPLVDIVVASMKDIFKEKNTSLKLVMPPNSIAMLSDKEALQKILLILLNNASNVTPPKGTVRLEVMSVENDKGKRFALIQVSDGGEGIPAQDLPQVFTPSYQAAHFSIPGIADAEMGLPVAKTLTEAIKGRIWVDSDLGKGSTFSVLVPMILDLEDDDQETEALVTKK